MNILLIFFALPIATIIISIALQKILKCPPLVAAIIFAIFLIVTFVINNLNFLIATIVYTIISFVTAVIVCLICRILSRLNRRESECNNGCMTVENSDRLLTLDGNFQNDCNNGVFTISASNNNDVSRNNGRCNCNNNCNCNNDNSSNAFSARINVIPNSNTNSRTGCLCGNYRRR